MDIKKKINDLLRTYRKIVEEKEKNIEETIGRPDQHDVWKEAVNERSCYVVMVKDLEKLLEECGDE